MGVILQFHLNSIEDMANGVQNEKQRIESKTEWNPGQVVVKQSLIP